MARVGEQCQRTGPHATARFHEQHERGEDEGEQQLAFTATEGVAVVVGVHVTVAMRVRMGVVVCHGAKARQSRRGYTITGARRTARGYARHGRYGPPSD